MTISGFLPLVTFSVYITMKFQVTKPDNTSDAANTERMIVSECISNYLTIASLANEDAIIERYFRNQSMRGKWGRSRFWKANKVAILYGFSQFMSTIYFFPTYYLVASNIDHNKSLLDSFTSQAIGVLGAFYFSTILLNAPDMGRGRKSANTILNIMQNPTEGSNAS